MKSKSAVVLYLSSSGNTARVAGWVAKALVRRGCTVTSFRIPDIRGMLPETINTADILFVGTPTYMWHTPGIVIEFLKSLEGIKNKPVGLFVTFGGVTVGSNLSAMASIVKKKKGKVVGLMQLEGQHAMMFRSDEPLAKGKPDERDIPHVDRFVELCLERAAVDDYQIKKVPGFMKYVSFLTPVPIARRFIPRVRLDPAKCTLCGKCVDNCPTHNISIFEGVIRHGPDCLPCYNCVRVCPTGAVNAGLESIEGPLRLISHVPERSAAVY